jgi:homoserine kinase type II
MDLTGRNDLIAVLARYPAIARPCKQPEALGNAGGGSGARLWRYESGRGRLVARAWPPESPSRAALEQIHGWLEQTAALGFVPIPIRALDERTVQEQGGRLWDVTAWIAGDPVPERPARAQLRSGLAALAAFHQALATNQTWGPSPAVQARRLEIEVLLQDGFDVVKRALDRAPTDLVGISARRWLERARPLARQLVAPLRRAAEREVRLQPCLRDARPEHLLFRGDRVTGLIDFGAMAVENVAADLARLLGEWIGPDRVERATALEAYCSIRPLEPFELTLMDVIAGSTALLGAGHWVRWHFLERRRFQDPTAVEHGIARGLQRLSAWTTAAQDGG